MPRSTNSPAAPPTPAEAARRQRVLDERAAHKRRYGLVAAHGGKELRNAVKTHFKNATFSTWPEAVAEFASGVTVSVACAGMGPRNQQRRWATHLLRFEPDGSVVMLSHPDMEVNPEAELMLAGLGGLMCTCVAAAVHLPTRIPMTQGLSKSTVHKTLRTLHTMVQWAQDPENELTASLGDATLSFGITPSILLEWVGRGWDSLLAIRFLQKYATPQVADLWLAAGDTTIRAAGLAGQGEAPNEEQRWAAAGFTPTQSAKWRKYRYSPAEAFDWHSHRVPPTMVDTLKRMSTLPQGPLPLDELKAWTKAGVYAVDVVGWYRDTNADLDTALAWKHPKIHPWEYKKVQEWNRANPTRTLNAEQVKGFVKVGFSATACEAISRAVYSGVTPARYLDAVESLPGPDGAAMRRFMDAETRTFKEWQRGFGPNGRGLGMLRRGNAELARLVVTWLIENP